MQHSMCLFWLVLCPTGHKFFIAPLCFVLLYSFYLRSIFLYTHSISHCSFELWLPELDAVFLEPSPQPHILLYVYIFPLYMLNSFLYPPQSLQPWAVICFFVVSKISLSLEACLRSLFQEVWPYIYILSFSCGLPQMMQPMIVHLSLESKWWN